MPARASRKGTSDKWLLVTYTVPMEPTRVRVGIWRALRKVGAVGVQRGVYVMPDTRENRALIERLAEEPKADFQMFVAAPVSDKQRELILAQGRKERAAEYEEVREKTDDFLTDLAKELKVNNLTYEELEENEADYKKLETWLKDARTRDWIGLDDDYARTKQHLGKAKDALDAFAEHIHEKLG